MSDDGFSPLGSGPAPIGPRTVAELIDIAEDQLDRAERLLCVLGCDNGVAGEPLAECQK